MALYSINNLKLMEVIDINTGSKIGYIRDLKMDCNNYSIISIIIPAEKTSLFSKNNYIEILWDKIVKVGVDVILVDENIVDIDNK
ncbi:YlmC/YmxH family sporulation protein [Clostridium ganghwense]|uniref:YlmC/YmxH family sporulation protein n=1 Tax=Clostridium ganghwense TaxID=312089 RepID=A0ABT4CTD1_9CLOT|nr:YlmC/YmxH family sporulation protein [Clostridium ganghwense]MCY6372335.1 YlmC/YmxH family sporulation protein [Clostridium ganghwense]